jgi:hypothetical protein
LSSLLLKVENVIMLNQAQNKRATRLVYLAEQGEGTAAPGSARDAEEEAILRLVRCLLLHRISEFEDNILHDITSTFICIGGKEREKKKKKK